MGSIDVSVDVQPFGDVGREIDTGLIAFVLRLDDDARLSHVVARYIILVCGVATAECDLIVLCYAGLKHGVLPVRTFRSVLKGLQTFIIEGIGMYLIIGCSKLVG